MALFYLFQITEQQTTSLREGWEQLRHRTASGEPVIVTGTTYELPYSHDYHNPRFLTPLLGSSIDGTPRQSIAECEISDHYVAVTHCDQSEVLVYDPIPHQFKGTVTIDTFTNFWQGNHQFKEFVGARGYDKLAPYRIIDVSLAMQYQEWEINEIAQMVLRRVCTAFLVGRTKTTQYRRYLSGIAINTYMQELFATYNTTQIDYHLSVLAKSLFEMRLSRYYLRDFIHDLCDKLSFPFYQHRERIDHVLAQWEQVHKTFVGLHRKRVKNHDQLLQTCRSLLADVSMCERRLHEDILDQLSSLVNLPKNKKGNLY